MMNAGEITSSNVSSYDPTKIKVVVGLSNNIDSFITAFLLKKQRFNVIGITILSWNKNLEDEEIEEQEIFDPLNENTAEKDIEFHEPRCAIDDPANIEKFCQWLGVPFYLSDASSEFDREVLEASIERRLQGRYFQPCLKCHTFKIEVLFAKAQKLGAHLIATGHYAKLHLNKNYNKHYLYKANDLENDQSYILSGLREEVLSKLMLPLGDIKRQEVNKLARIHLKGKISVENIGSVKNKNIRKNEFDHCLIGDVNMVNHIHQKVPKVFWKSVTLVSKTSEMIEGEFDGRFYLQYGALKSKIVEGRIIDRTRILQFKDQRAYSGTTDEFKTKYFEAHKLKIMYNVSRLKPINGYLKRENQELQHIIISFKSSNRALIEVDTAQCFHPDEKIVIYDSDSAMAKIIGEGYIASRVNNFFEDRLVDFREDNTEFTDKDIFEGF
jgi:tRNA U34 2-thiouridine synthase MnmA/TrmU